MAGSPATRLSAEAEAIIDRRMLAGRRAVSLRAAMRAAAALMAAHPGSVIVPAELRGDRVGLWARVPGAWLLGDAGEVAAWLDREAPAA